MRTLSTLVLILGLAACRGGDDGGGGGNPDAPGNSDDTTIQQIQNDSMPACDPANPATCVELKIKGVIVTAIDAYGSKTGDFWVEEPGGGPFSGVHVYGAPLDQVSALAIGDVVDIAGAEKSEFALSSDTSGNKLTELEPVQGGTMSVTKVMSGTPITPDVVDALTIGQMTDFMARAAEWEKWEGVLIKVNNVSAMTSDACVGTMCTDATLHKFDVTGDVSVESSLAAMPMPTVARGDCLAGVTGVLDYFFDYQILPRTTAEIETGGSSCPPPEASPALCTDGIDNDGNGFADCNDNNCITAEATCRTVTTITALQTQTLPTGAVELDNVYVTGVSFSKKDVFVSTNVNSAANEGIQLHFNTAVPNTVVVGKQVTVIGKATEFNDSMNVGTQTVTELNGLSITVGSAAAATTVGVTGVSATTLDSDTTGEPYEGVLVTLTLVKITTVADATNHIGTFTQGTHDFKYDDVIFRIPEGTSGRPVGTCYTTITGVWSYNVFDNNWVFYPRASATSSTTEDGTQGTGC